MSSLVDRPSIPGTTPLFDTSQATGSHRRRSRKLPSAAISPASYTQQHVQLIQKPILHIETDLDVPNDTPDPSFNDHLDAIRARVANDVAFRAIREAQTINDVKVGVALLVSDSEHSIRAVLAALHRKLSPTTEYLFAVAPADPPSPKRLTALALSESDFSTPMSVWPLSLIASNAGLLEKASTLASAKFLGRIKSIYTSASGTRWIAYIQDIGQTTHDDAMLWDIIRKTPHVVNPCTPPLGSRGIKDILSAARTRLARLTPAQAQNELVDLTLPLPVILVDIRSDKERAMHGAIPDALTIERNSLEFTLDPRSDSHLSVANRYDLRVILVSQDGDASSLAAVALHDIGLLNATDVVGGFKAWKEAGLPATTIATMTTLGDIRF